MALIKLSSKQKLIAIICISFSFFVAEIAVAFYTGSLALLADAFHYLNDLIGFVIALTAIIVSESAKSPQYFSFGWARAQLLGAFFNGVFLLALGLSIFLQSLERFISIQPVENPKLVLIIGAVGLALNILSATLLHEHHGHDHGGHSHGHGHAHGEHDHEHAGHDHEHGHGHGHEHSHDHANVEAAIPLERHSHSLENPVPSPIHAHAEHRHTVVKLQAPGRDLGMLGVFVHVLGDALNNVAVIIAALIIWLTKSPNRFYADPGISTFISIFIFASSIPLVKNSGKILMQSAPRDVDLEDVKHDLEKIPGIESVHELHIWRLDQKKAIASAHVVVSNNEMTDFMDQAKTVKECLHAYGIHSATVQPELAEPARTISPAPNPAANEESGNASEDTAAAGAATTSGAGVASPSPAASLRRRRADGPGCQIVCGNICESLTCCNTSGPLRM